LMIDDSISGRDVLRHHLDCIGCEVVAEAENTQQALALFRTVAPSLVALEVGVPQTGGIGALALVRIMRSERPDVRVLTMGTLAFPEVRKSFLREGVLDYIIKPLDAHSFAQVHNRLEESFPQLIGPNRGFEQHTDQSSGGRTTGPAGPGRCSRTSHARAVTPSDGRKTEPRRRAPGERSGEICDGRSGRGAHNGA